MSALALARRYAHAFQAAWAIEAKRPKPRRNADELAFLPEALEIVETPASPAGRAILGSIIGFFALALLWAGLAEIDIHATALGRIMPFDNLMEVQHEQGGTVARLLVNNGDPVEAGQVLVELDPLVGDADRVRLERELAEQWVKAARLAAQLAPDPLRAFRLPADLVPAPGPDLVARQRHLLQSRVDQHRATLAGIDRDSESRKAEMRAIAADVARLEATVPILRERTEARETLAAAGHAARMQALELRQGLLDREHELQSARERLDRTRADVVRLAETRRETEARFQSETLAELAEAERQADGLAQEWRKAEQRATRLVIRAPAAGWVQQRTVNTVGGVVKPGETLMRIVPDQRRLVVEAYLPSKDVGRVRAGQKAEIKLEAFNFTLYGTLPGVVESVSASAVETPARPDAPQQAPLPPASAGAERHYAVRVGLERGAMVVEKGETVPLLPGMVATVEVKIGERRIIQYLLSPLIRVAKEGLREW